MTERLTHVAGTFLIQADGAFLNGAGLGEGEDRNVTIPKTFRELRERIPYVSAQAWKRWLRNTLIDETGWPASEIRAIGLSAKETTSKISGELDPVNFAEDDIFGYMRAEKQKRSTSEETEESEEGKEEAGSTRGERTKSVMRSSPFAASLLISIRRSGWQGRDEGFVHLKEGTPLPYTTEFYNTHLQAVFCLNYSRMGVFWNLGDRIELDETKAEILLREKKIKVVKDEGKLGKVYEIVDADNSRKQRVSALLKALVVLRGGAKQAQFGADVSPKVIVIAGLSCGNPIFNHLFKDDVEGPILKIDTLKEVIIDYADRIVTPVYIGIRSGYLKNEDEVKKLSNQEIASVKESERQHIQVKVMTPIEAAHALCEKF